MIQFREQAQQAIPVAEEEVIQFAKDRMKQGLAPPREVYRIEYRHSIDWAEYPTWAHPVDPELTKAVVTKGKHPHRPFDTFSLGCAIV